MTKRTFYFLSFLIVAIALACGHYIEDVLGIMPCPLCLMQRFAFVAIGIWSALAFIFVRFNLVRKICTFFIGFNAFVGLCLAGRQIYLQHYAIGAHEECGVSLQYMAQVLPIQELVKKVLSGSAECTTRGWELLHLNMPEWSALLFLGFIAFAFFINKKH